MFRRFRRACGRLRFRCPAACRRFRGMGCMFCAMGLASRRPGAAGVRGACFFSVRCALSVSRLRFPGKIFLKKARKSLVRMVKL